MKNIYENAEPEGGRPGSGGRADGNCKPHEQQHWETLLKWPPGETQNRRNFYNFIAYFTFCNLLMHIMGLHPASQYPCHRTMTMMRDA